MDERGGREGGGGREGRGERREKSRKQSTLNPLWWLLVKSYLQIDRVGGVPITGGMVTTCMYFGCCQHELPVH